MQRLAAFGYLADNPPTAEEVLKAQQNQTLTLAGQWETNNAVEASIGEMVQYNLPEDYWDTLSETVRSLDVDDVAEIAAKTLHPDEVIWVVVGDRREIEEGIRELDLGEIRLIDADGQPR